VANTIRVRAWYWYSCDDDRYTLLDASKLVATSPMDLRNTHHHPSPDFVAMSFYKVFGFPTGE
jgi:hypothetical protein